MMNETLLLLAWLTPLAALVPAIGRGGRWWMPAAVLPALAAALLVPVDTWFDIPWLLPDDLAMPAEQVEAIASRMKRHGLSVTVGG